MYIRYIKRILDIVLSFVGLILSSWLFLIIIAAIEIDDPGPVFFTQKRVGIRKKHFNLYKFRSMKMSTPEASKKRRGSAVPICRQKTRKWEQTRIFGIKNGVR